MKKDDEFPTGIQVVYAVPAGINLWSHLEQIEIDSSVCTREMTSFYERKSPLLPLNRP